MDADPAGQAFEFFRSFVKTGHRWIVLNRRLQVGIFLLGGSQGDAQLRRNHLGHAVGVAITHPENPSAVADHRFGTKGAKGDDVADAAFAVFLADVFDDFRPARLAEVDVDIRRTDTFGIEEPFENQAEAQRVAIGNPQRISHQRAGGRSASRTDRNAVVLGPFDEVPDDQEVAEKTHLRHDLHLVVETGLQLLGMGTLTEPDFQSLAADALEIFLPRAAIRRVKLRVFFRGGGVQLDIDIHLVGDLQSAPQRLRHVFEELDHFLGRLEIDLLGILHPVLIEDHLAGADADHDIVRGVVGAVEKMHIIGRHRFDVILLRPFQQLDGALPLGLGHIPVDVVVQFQVKIITPPFLEPLHRAPGVIQLAGADRFVDLAVEAA